MGSQVLKTFRNKEEEHDEDYVDDDDDNNDEDEEQGEDGTYADGNDDIRFPLLLLSSYFSTTLRETRSVT